MKTRILGIALIGVAACTGSSFGAERQAAKAAAPAAGVEARLPGYMNNFLPWDPASKVTVEKAADRFAGFQAYKVKRTGKYPKLNADQTVFVSDDGKFFFDGDPIANPNPRPVRSEADLAWIEARTSQLYRTRVKAALTPDRDAAGLKGVVLAVDSGFLPMHVPGYITPDGTKFLSGSLYDFQMDPREERKKWIDLSQGRFDGKPNGSIIMVEYADMQCPYCRYRGTQLDQLLEANPNLSYKRYYKFFVLWFTHEWSTRAASAADCIFRFAKAPAMFAFKRQVYSQQAVLSVAGIDELAVTFAESAGIPRTDFLNCYLRDESLRDVFKDVDEGQRLGVKSTPTYFIDGTEINWIEDKVMEDFLRTKDPSLKSIEYQPPH